MEEKRLGTVNIDNDIHQGLKKLANETGIPIQTIVKGCLEKKQLENCMKGLMDK